MKINGVQPTFTHNDRYATLPLASDVTSVALGSRDAHRRTKSCTSHPVTDKMGEAEETLKRIDTHKGVIGTIVVNAEGIPIRSSLDNSTSVQYAGLLRHLTTMARSTVRDIDPQNDLICLRMRSKKHEIMVAPENNFLLIIIQNLCE
uniref:Roadblock/LAMTOR2 domain-containing protein n=1 Tax=Monopterus albus TaxID=43700 RepID=A0A3Q3IQJ2_MONAL|nr:dynein light chain roadblock-type 2 isoform X1 [Monopterus albus]